MSVDRSQRFTRKRPCPICGGSDDVPRGNGIRCFGFLSDDSKYAHCTREEKAGAISVIPESDTYAHRLNGSCECGVQHGQFSRPAPSKSRRQQVTTYES